MIILVVAGILALTNKNNDEKANANVALTNALSTNAAIFTNTNNASANANVADSANTNTTFLNTNTAVSVNASTVNASNTNVSEKNVSNINTNTAVSEPELKPSTATVTHNDSGFSPKSVTVKVGDTVRFTNASDDLMWVASDFHPTHTKLSGFDEKNAAGKGGSYEFIFTKSGTWSYHNHIQTSETGSVIVE